MKHRMQRDANGQYTERLLINAAKEFIDARAVAIETRLPGDRRMQNMMASVLAMMVADLRQAEAPAPARPAKEGGE